MLQELLNFKFDLKQAIASSALLLTLPEAPVFLSAAMFDFMGCLFVHCFSITQRSVSISCTEAEIFAALMMPAISYFFVNCSPISAFYRRHLPRFALTVKECPIHLLILSLLTLKTEKHV